MAFLVGSGGGTFIGGALNKALYDKDPLLCEAFISLVYAVLLGFLGFYAMVDFLKSKRKGSWRRWGARCPWRVIGHDRAVQKSPEHEAPPDDHL